MANPTSYQLASLKMAIIFKAVRFLKMPESPFGIWGEFPDGGAGFVQVKPDYQIEEYLIGLRGVEDIWGNSESESESESDIESVIAALVTPADVLRVGLGDPEEDTLPAGYEDHIQGAIDAAIHWVAQKINPDTAWGIA